MDVCQIEIGISITLDLFEPHFQKPEVADGGLGTFPLWTMEDVRMDETVAF